MSTIENTHNANNLGPDPYEGGLPWTEEATAEFQRGRINATQASIMSGIEHPTETVSVSTPTPDKSTRPLTARELRQRDVGNAALQHKPPVYRNFTQERLARERGETSE